MGKFPSPSPRFAFAIARSNVFPAGTRLGVPHPGQTMVATSLGFVGAGCSTATARDTPRDGWAIHDANRSGREALRPRPSTWTLSDAAWSGSRRVYFISNNDGGR